MSIKLRGIIRFDFVVLLLIMYFARGIYFRSEGYRIG